LYDFLELQNTKAFIVLKDGKIVLEKYFGTHTQNDPWYWASAGKTLTAFMTGIAQQEGFLSIDDTTSQYLGTGWTSCTQAQEEKITIRDQLSMTSGLNDAVADPFCTLPSCLTYAANAGSRWAYHNGPYTLLDQVIQSATGSTLNSYTFLKLLFPTGMTGAFYPVGYNNVFLSTARSMARFGLLMLNNGNWNGNQIMTDQNYFNQMVNTSQPINESYGYLWWLNGKPTFMVPGIQLAFNGPLIPNAPADMIAAMGKNGQFLNVVPSQNLVWIRMGDAPDSSAVPFLLNDEIWSYINELNCVTSLPEPDEPSINVFPNPSGRDGFEITGLDSFAETNLVIFDLQGRLLLEMNTVGKTEVKIQHQLQKGSYVIRVRGKNGQFTKVMQVI
jgi:CubicO group peptidase (beta-lactamase class C family)